MKPALALTIGFAVSALGSTGVKVALHKPVPDTSLAHDSTGADTLAGAHASVPDTIAGAGGADSSVASSVGAKAPASPADSASRRGSPVPLAPLAGGSQTPSGSAVADSAKKSRIADSIMEQSTGRLGKAFGGMPPKNAGSVLALLSDSDALIILDRVGPKQAAAILATLTPERAAALTKAVLRKKPL